MPPTSRPHFFRRPLKGLTCLASVGIIVAGSLLASAPAALADTTVTVNWTQIGIFPRAGASMDSDKVGNALSDGTSVSLACETEGQPVTNGYQTISIWDQLTDGTWLPNAFLDTGTASWTPGIPRCTEAPSDSPAVPDVVIHYDGDHLPTDQPIALSLLRHYLAGSGRRAVLDASVMDVPGFADEVRSLAIGQIAVWTPPKNTDLFWASGSFTISRETTNCWATWDHYDFDPDKPSNVPYLDLWAAQAAGARSFNVNASGCLSS